ncbi:cytochrome c [Sphingomonas sp. ID1715]|uniref:c-type cytochrome n=1 Tax=Sphingomonas sp. ID1715 TaxID=1656898 RepID=UPI001488B414|nr:cytochrome c [Sphingomonas sp. ID1715]NNM77803.1 cytochrome c [Sphingomonas sp. ID1715]
MRRPVLLALGYWALIAAGKPPGAVDPGGGAVPIPPANADDVTADVAAWIAPANAADQSSPDPVARGRYLAITGDCEACHTTPGGARFAGARPIRTPFGIIYSANMTPDQKTGIGTWTDDEFYRAMHKGIGHGGKNLYPAFPYPYFTHMTRADIDAIRAYLATVPAVDQPKPPNQLPFPFNIRFLLKLWNALFFQAGEFRPDPAKSAVWNRGAYLVWGPGHCGGCHTPKNFLAADRNSRALQGGRLDNWVAVNLTGDPQQGLASWGEADIVEYLRSGRNARASASGSMQEVIYYSTSRMSDADLAAIATYLKDLPPGAPKSGRKAPSAAAMRAGEAIFTDVCSACHQANGEGVARIFPPLAGDASVQAKDPTTLVRIILEGTRSVSTPVRPTPTAMPAFGWKLDDEAIASVATFVRNSWGNSAPPVSARKVAKLRRQTRSAAAPHS